MSAAKTYPPLADERRSHVDTECAAFHLNRSAQTLRLWSCKDTGPIKPVTISRRLAWPVSDLKKLLHIEGSPA